MKLKLKSVEIDRRRAVRGWLLGDLARASHLHPNTITRILAGGAIGIVAARKVCAALELELSEVVDGFVDGASEAAVAGAA
ncbi:MAG TPA: helix-turn-helix transcriptional regulator [Phycisphaerae bacterium]|nr:helix-turn-helix transcriptional regulator [Phycisphaerae bacterium]